MDKSHWDIGGEYRRKIPPDCISRAEWYLSISANVVSDIAATAAFDVAKIARRVLECV
jgi:hypothetical protein